MAKTKKKSKSLTETFSVKTLKKGFEKLTGDLARNLRGVKRGTRGISRPRGEKRK